ncbi:MAG: hypothetical protein E7257_10270 [Lachnospiraceae bacterium]|nr:hypothetical protein [Lachnospiraceae bacterium]
MGFGIWINQESVNSKISDLEEICENIGIKMAELDLVEDSFSEGEFYDGYLQAIFRLKKSMEKTKTALEGYINVLRYATDNYNQMDSEMAVALESNEG